MIGECGMNIETEKYLRQARKDKKSVKEMMAYLNRSESAVQRYLKELGLTAPGNLKLTVDEVVTDYNNGMTCNEIAKKYGVSHAAITNRLAKAGIKPGRAENIRKHFDATYQARWPAAREMLDEGISFSETARMLKMRPEHLRYLIEANRYERSMRYDETIIISKLRTLCDESSNAKRQVAALKYADAIDAYVAKYKCLPTMSQLARHMNITPQTVCSWFKSVGLSEYLPTNKRSYLVNAVIALLNDMEIRYDLNRHDIITPFEIDIWLYEYDTGIEVNPVTTHSPDAHWGKRSQTYHQDKSIKALKKGIGFAHVYDFDMTDEKRWKSFMIWLQMVKDGKRHMGGPVNLDRFLKGARMHDEDEVPEPPCMLVNPNTLEYRHNDLDDAERTKQHFFRVYTAGCMK